MLDNNRPRYYIAYEILNYDRRSYNNSSGVRRGEKYVSIDSIQ